MMMMAGTSDYRADTSRCFKISVCLTGASIHIFLLNPMTTSHLPVKVFTKVPSGFKVSKLYERSFKVSLGIKAF